MIWQYWRAAVCPRRLYLNDHLYAGTINVILFDRLLEHNWPRAHWRQSYIMKDSSADNLQEASFIARYRGRIVAVLWVGVLLWSAPLLHLYVGEGGPIAWISDFSFRWRPGCGYGSTSDLIRSVVVRTYLFFTPAFMGIIFIRILSKRTKIALNPMQRYFALLQQT